jgi:hypothetical protein
LLLLLEIWFQKLNFEITFHVKFINLLRFILQSINRLLVLCRLVDWFREATLHN